MSSQWSDKVISGIMHINMEGRFNVRSDMTFCHFVNNSILKEYMSHLQYFDYKGFGERSRKDAHYSQAVQVGDIIEISGQGM
jgi:hypothetical protein